MLMKNLLAVKSIADLKAESDKGELRRTLGATALTEIGIACGTAGDCPLRTKREH